MDNLLNIDLGKLIFNHDIAEVNEQVTKNHQISVVFEILTRTCSMLSIEDEARESHYRFDFSATNLPLKSKRFSFFKSSPLLSFFEIISSGDTPIPIHESDVSKNLTCDPFWTLTPPLSISQLSPAFTVNIY